MYTAANSYRYGFNGKESDGEIKGIGNEVDFGYRIYDPRIGRFLSIDPLQRKYRNESNYIFVSNSPNIFADKDGREKIVTVTVIDNEGKRTSVSSVVDKNYVYYDHVDIPGIGNDRYYEIDVKVNWIIDLRGNTPKVTYSEALGERHETSIAMYYYGKLADWSGRELPRGHQKGGITLTSEFSSQVDGPKTDATEGPPNAMNVDLILAAFDAIAKKAKPLKFKFEDAADVEKLAYEIMEAYTPKTNTGQKSDLKPIDRSTPERPGPGWDEYTFEKDKITRKTSGRTVAMPDSIRKGKNGAPDTIFHRPYKAPPVPRHEIKRH